MPLLVPPPPPPARAPGCGRRRLSRSRRRRSKRAERGIWAELPRDALLNVLHRLDHVELMFGGAAKVCRSWRAVAREPELWRRVDMRGHSRLFRETISLDRMARLSIWFSAGQCESFFAEEDVDDGLLLFLAKQAPLLKSLHLTECCDVTNEAFAEAISKFHLLEELELCRCYGIYDTVRVFEVVATACPRLKHFKHVKNEGYEQYHRVLYPVDHNSEAMAIARMHELRSMQLSCGSLDSQGLTTILDNCPHLESLEIRSCRNVNVMDSSLRAKCAHVKTKKLYPYVFAGDWDHFRSGSYDEFTDDSEYFETGSPISSCSTWDMYCHDDDERDCQFFFIEPYDSDDSDHSRYFSGPDETEFEEHDRILPKGMRRCMMI